MKSRNWWKLLYLLPICACTVYAGGYVAQFIKNYQEWTAAGNFAGNGTYPKPASLHPLDCIHTILHYFPYNLYGIFLCLTVFGLITFLLMRMGNDRNGEISDRDRNFNYSTQGTYGTSGFMTWDEMFKVLELAGDVRKNQGTILGKLNGKAVCLPNKTRLNRNIAVYGASGSMKSRAFARNMIFQCVARGESLIITDPKSELYESMSVYLENEGYTVKAFNLVNPENSDSWNCLGEINGQETMAQVFADVIIQNTGSGKGDHFWDNAEMNLLKALVLYVDQGFPAEAKNIGQVYKLLTMSSEKELNSLFDLLPVSHPAKVPYCIYKQAIGKRKLLTPDEILRLPLDEALIILRGQKVLRVEKYDYTLHPDAKKLIPRKASDHIPAWRENGIHEESDYMPKSPATATRKKRGSASGNTARKKVQEPLYISEPVYQEPCYDEFNPEFLSEDSEDNFPDSEMVPLDKKSIMS
jgi:type IV secretory pathway TraG/TraD family ATPase VirD4